MQRLFCLGSASAPLLPPRCSPAPDAEARRCRRAAARVKLLRPRRWALMLAPASAAACAGRTQATDAGHDVIKGSQRKREFRQRKR